VIATPEVALKEIVSVSSLFAFAVYTAVHVAVILKDGVHAVIRMKWWLGAKRICCKGKALFILC